LSSHAELLRVRLSFNFEPQQFLGGMGWWLVAGLVIGGAVASLNFYLSFLAAPAHRLRHGAWPERVPSGFPIIGSLLLGAVALALPIGSSVQVVALILLALDTGGPHWFVASRAWEALERRRRR
jgi:hypothetical protein